MQGYVKDHKEEGNFLWLTMEADPELFKSTYWKHFDKVIKRLSIPGFRKGHAPLDMSIQYMKNKGSFGNELRTVVSQVIEQTVIKMSETEKEWDEKIFGLPVENQVKDVDLEKWTLQFESKFEKFPVITLSDYSKIETLIEHKEPDLDICPFAEDKEAEQDDVVAVAMMGKDSQGQPINKYVYDVLEIDLGKTKINKQIVEAIIGSKAKDKKELKIKDGGEEVSLEIWIIEVRKKLPVNQDLVQKLNLPNIDSAEKLKESIKHQYEMHNSYVRYHDILKWLYSRSNQVEPFPVEAVRREASKIYHQFVERGHKNASFESIYYDHSKNLKTTLVLDAISKKENIKVDDKDKEAFAKNIEECPWIYGNRRVEDIFNCPEEVLKEYITQFKTIRFLSERWVFSS